MSKFLVFTFCVALSSGNIFRNSAYGQDDSSPITEATTTTGPPDTPYNFILDLDLDFTHYSWGHPPFDDIANEFYFYYYANLETGLSQSARVYLTEAGVDIDKLKEGTQGVWASFNGLHNSDPCYTTTTTTVRTAPSTTTLPTNGTTTTASTTPEPEPCWTKEYPAISFSTNNNDAVILQSVELRYFVHNGANIFISTVANHKDIFGRSVFEACNNTYTGSWVDCDVVVPLNTSKISIELRAYQKDEAILVDRIVVKTMGYTPTTTTTTVRTSTSTTEPPTTVTEPMTSAVPSEMTEISSTTTSQSVSTTSPSDVTFSTTNSTTESSTDEPNETTISTDASSSISPEFTTITSPTVPMSSSTPTDQISTTQKSGGSNISVKLCNIITPSIALVFNLLLRNY